MTSSRIPVHVLTGFLGSGKTTLLSSLLSRPALRDTLVIVNEVGEVGFDHLLLTEAREEVVVQLDGGCVCCVVRGDLLRTLATAHERFAGEGGRPFSRVVIETSGLATPDAILRTIMLDDTLARNYSLGRVAATFDVVHGAQTLATYAEAQAQLAAAETVVLTKLDLLEEARHAAATAELQAFNPGAELCSSPAFLARAGGWLEPGGQFDPGASQARVQSGHDIARPFPHTHNIQTFTLRCPKPLERRRFNEWMSVRLRFLHGQILRVKGLVQLSDSELPVFVHGVQQMFHPPRVLENWPSAEPETHLVFITQGIPDEVVRRSFFEYLFPDGNDVHQDGRRTSDTHD